jgi:hypothetical protein
MYDWEAPATAAAQCHARPASSAALPVDMDVQVVRRFPLSGSSHRLVLPCTDPFAAAFA